MDIYRRTFSRSKALPRPEAKHWAKASASQYASAKVSVRKSYSLRSGYKGLKCCTREQTKGTLCREVRFSSMQTGFVPIHEPTHGSVLVFATAFPIFLAAT